MNLKLLEKLVKLANNNPNEHEANSAARRACKLIAEGEFKFVDDKVQSKQTTLERTIFTSNPGQSQYDWMKDIFERQGRGPFWDFDFSYKDRKTTWGEKKRNLTCMKCGNTFGSTYPHDPKTFQCDDCLGIGKNKSPYTGPSFHPNDKKYYDRRTERGFGHTRRVLNCKICKKAKETKFTGKEENYKCNACIWERIV